MPAQSSSQNYSETPHFTAKNKQVSQYDALLCIIFWTMFPANNFAVQKRKRSGVPLFFLLKKVPRQGAQDHHKKNIFQSESPNRMVRAPKRLSHVFCLTTEKKKYNMIKINKKIYKNPLFAVLKQI